MAMRFLRFALFVIPFSATLPAGKTLAAPLPAAAVPADPKEALAGARTALQDGLFTVADERLSAWLKNNAQSEQAAAAHVMQAEALYHLGRFDDAAKSARAALATPEAAAIKPEALNWLAESLTLAHQYPEAEAVTRELLADLERETRGPLQKMLEFFRFAPDRAEEDAQLRLAWLLLSQGKRDESDKILDRLSQPDSEGRASLAAQLLRARSLLASGKRDEAIPILQTLAEKMSTAPEIAGEAACWLGEALLEKNDSVEAADAFQRLTGYTKPPRKDLVARAWFGLGRARLSLGETDAASTALEKAFTLTASEAIRQPAYQLYLQSARAQKRLPEAVARLQSLAKDKKDQGQTAAALYAIGEAWVQNGETDKAIGTLEALLVAYPQSRWREPAGFLLSRIYEEKGEIETALQALDRLQPVEIDDMAHPPDESRDRIDFEIARLLLRKGDSVSALERLARLRASKGAMADEAWYHSLLALSQAGKIDEFRKLENSMPASARSGAHGRDLIFLRGSLEERQGLNDRARETYESALKAADADLRAEILMRLGRLSVLSGQPGEAVQHYQRFIEEFPNHPVVAEAKRRAILASRNAGLSSDNDAISSLLALLEEFPDGPKAPELLMHLGDLYFNRGDFANAQVHFERLIRQYPQSPLIHEAHFLAGMAASRHGDLGSALALLDKIPDSSPLKAEARMLQAQLFQRQLKFDAALSLYHDLLSKEKPGTLAVDAVLGKGDCLFALGEKDRANFEQAAAAYGLIINGGHGTAAQRNEAGFRRARSYEKLGRGEDALALYLDVLYGRLHPKNPSRQPGTADSHASSTLPEQIWQTKAGLEAARIKEEREDWRGAIEVYRRLEELGGPNRDQFRDMRNRIRRDQYIYE
jgi:tetratricopeptide (TPR) repeat protein